jgi:hypothetical protein
MRATLADVGPVHFHTKVSRTFVPSGDTMCRCPSVPSDGSADTGTFHSTWVVQPGAQSAWCPESVIVTTGSDSDASKTGWEYRSMFIHDVIPPRRSVDVIAPEAGSSWRLGSAGVFHGDDDANGALALLTASDDEVESDDDAARASSSTPTNATSWRRRVNRVRQPGTAWA